MGATPARPARKGSPLPKLLQAVLIVSVAGVLALWTAHIAQSGAAGQSGPPRLLLQGALELAQATQQPSAVLHAAPDGDAGLQPQPQDEPVQQNWQAAVGAPAVPGQQEPVGAAGAVGQQLDGESELPLNQEQQERPQQQAQQQGGDDDGDDWSAGSSSTSSSGSSASSSSSSSSSASGSLAGGISAAGDEADGPAYLTLHDTSDLATFTDPGTRCVVTPSHGKVGPGCSGLEQAQMGGNGWHRKA